MTANELADELNECSCVYYDSTTNQYFNDVELSSKVATMLRQQAVLEANQKIQLNIIKKQYEYITGLENQIEQLKSDLEDCTCQGGHSEAYLKAKGR
jgi:hypothetical protein